MSRVVIPCDGNETLAFLHIVNYLVSYKLMSLEEADGPYRKFRLGEDVVFDIPDEMDSAFKGYLDSLNCKHE